MFTRQFFEDKARTRQLGNLRGKEWGKATASRTTSHQSSDNACRLNWIKKNIVNTWPNATRKVFKTVPGDVEVSHIVAVCQPLAQSPSTPESQVAKVPCSLSFTTDQLYKQTYLLTYLLAESKCWRAPVLQLGLSLYFCVRQMSTTAAFSTASAIASRTDPPAKTQTKLWQVYDVTCDVTTWSTTRPWWRSEAWVLMIRCCPYIPVSHITYTVLAGT